MDDSKYFKEYESKSTEFESAEKEKQFPRFLVGKSFSLKVGFWNSGSLKFKTLFREKNLKKLAKPNN